LQVYRVRPLYTDFLGSKTIFKTRRWKWGSFGRKNKNRLVTYPKLALLLLEETFFESDPAETVGDLDDYINNWNYMNEHGFFGIIRNADHEAGSVCLARQRAPKGRARKVWGEVLWIFGQVHDCRRGFVGALGMSEGEGGETGDSRLLANSLFLAANRFSPHPNQLKEKRVGGPLPKGTKGTSGVSNGNLGHQPFRDRGLDSEEKGEGVGSLDD